MLTDEYISRIAEYAFSLLDEFRVILDDGREETIPIAYHELEGNYLKVLGYLQDDVVGNIKEVQVLMEVDTVAISKEYELVKSNSHGVMLAFAIRIDEGEVV